MLSDQFYSKSPYQVTGKDISWTIRTSNLHGINGCTARSRLLIGICSSALLCRVVHRSTARFCAARVCNGRTMLAAIVEILEFGFLSAMLKGQAYQV